MGFCPLGIFSYMGFCPLGIFSYMGFCPHGILSGYLRIHRDGHDFDFEIKIMILNHLIFSDLDFDFKSSEISMILILKRIQNQNHSMTSYYK